MSRLFTWTAAALLAVSAPGWALGQARAPSAQYSPQDVVRAYAPPASPSAQPGAPAAAADGCPADTVLGSEGLCEPVVKSRGFSLVGPGASGSSPSRPAPGRTPAAGARVASVPVRAPAAPRRPLARTAVTPGDLLITFKLGSAELTDQGRANARSFATALNDPALAPVRFEIGGYTDATGQADRNLALSQARADSVRTFLVAQGVDASRLQAKGYGSENLALPGSPKAAANRRVEGRRLN